MIDLENSGLHVSINLDDYLLKFADEVSYLEAANKKTSDMKELLYDREFSSEETFYDFYIGVTRKRDLAIFSQNNLRYDLIVVRPGTAGVECKKTSGHYHLPIDGDEISYPEIYEVIMGKALYILQNVNNNAAGKETLIVNETLFVEVEAGQKIIIPPNYGHASVNIGDGPLVFADLVSTRCKNSYSSIRNLKGMSHYITNTRNKLEFTKNINYLNVLNSTLVYPKENKALGIDFQKSVYECFVANPEKFKYLNEPQNYIVDIKNGLSLYKS